MRIDFTKAKIGQPVTCLMFGKGIITAIGGSNRYCVWIEFENGEEEVFTSDGRYYDNNRPTLMVGHIELPNIDQGELPKTEPKPLVFDGTPKWAYVSDGTYKDAELRGRRHVIAGSSDTSWCAITAGKANTESGKVTHWKYAWELGDA